MPRSLPLALLRQPPATALCALLAVLLFIAAMVLLQHGGDRWWADQLYALEGGHWRYRDAWWASQLLHVGGKWLSVGAGLAVAAGMALAWCRPGMARWRRPLAYLLLSVALSTTLVSLIKSISALDCPWDLARYGGQRPWLNPVQTWLAHGSDRHGCFPAGHASAGYAWIALYFLARERAPRWRVPALLLALGLGATFGLTQQLRGAHFLSHDLASLALCWLCAWALAQPMLGSAPHPGMSA